MNDSPHQRSVLDRGFQFIERRHSSDRLLLQLIIFALVAAFIYGVVLLNRSFTTDTAIAGGTLTEGVVGAPRFVNPVLATTRADQDMTALVYRGLMKINSDGELVPDLAESVTVSPNGRTYTVVLRDGITFHDGTPVTARDVSYTIGLIQNPDLKSPLRSNWFGVLIEELSERELNIVLESAYAPFIENLTVGILPQDLWNELPIEQLPFSQHNTEPVGAGPYQVESIQRDKSGLISGYTLRAFAGYEPQPRLETVVVEFFRNEGDLFSALETGDIDSTASLDTDQIDSIAAPYTVHELPLPRTFTLFFNQNRSPALRDQAAREALSAAIDRPALVADVLNGRGNPTRSPIPPGFGATAIQSTSTATSSPLDIARTILREGGWTQNDEGIWQKVVGEDTVPLEVVITTANTDVFEATAAAVADAWTELGARVSVAQYAQGDLVQAIIKPRDFAVLLFGADVGRSVDLYSFWHSSQKDDPGLNVAQYTNIDTDSLLDDLQTTASSSERAALLSEIESIIIDEQPAVFLYSPILPYVTHEDLSFTPVAHIGSPSDRFMNIEEWFIESDAVWPLFSDN